MLHRGHFNPRCMHEGYGSHSVCLLPSYLYVPRLHVENRVPLGFLCHSQRVYCVDFVENALFKSSGEIYWSPLPSSLLYELLMEKTNSDGLFLRRLACRTSDGSYNSTDSSLATVDYQQSFLALCVAKLLIRHVHGIIGMHGHAAYYVIVCTYMYIYICAFLWLLDV